MNKNITICCFQTHSFRERSWLFLGTIQWFLTTAQEITIAHWAFIKSSLKNSNVSTSQVKWNVTPLIGDFGGRVGINIFLQSPLIPRMLPSLFICRDFSLFVPLTVCVHACRSKGLLKGLQWVHAPGEVQKKIKKCSHKRYESKELQTLTALSLSYFLC